MNSTQSMTVDQSLPIQEEQLVAEGTTNDLYKKTKATAHRVIHQTTRGVKKIAKDDQLVKNGLILSLGATLLTTAKGLRHVHPWAGAALVGFSIWHILQGRHHRHSKSKPQNMPPQEAPSTLAMVCEESSPSASEDTI